MFLQIKNVENQGWSAKAFEWDAFIEILLQGDHLLSAISEKIEHNESMLRYHVEPGYFYRYPVIFWWDDEIR